MAVGNLSGLPQPAPHSLASLIAVRSGEGTLISPTTCFLGGKKGSTLMEAAAPPWQTWTPILSPGHQVPQEKL